MGDPTRATVERSRPRRRWFLWPVLGLWRVASAVEVRLGIPWTLALGCGLVTSGLFLSVTLIALPAGLASLLFGTFLTLRALY